MRRGALSQTWWFVLVCLLLTASPVAGLRAEGAGFQPASALIRQSTAEPHKVGAEPHAQQVARLGWFSITNSMIMTWIIAVGMIVFAQLATRKRRLIPNHLQNLWEWQVEGLYNFLEDIIGPQLLKKTFWLFASIFIFILFSSWLAVVPGVGTVGWKEHLANGQTRWLPLFRGVDADLNMPLAMALVFFACWTVWALQARGTWGFLFHLFGPKSKLSGVLGALMVLVFIGAAILEVVSILVRPISLSFRLFGNLYAGEEMLATLTSGAPVLSWIVPVPFYLLELLFGWVQALIFMLLTAVFTLLICQEEEEPAHES